MIGTILFLPFRIKEKVNTKDYIPFSEYIAKTLEIVKGHKNFHRYLISRVFYSSCLPGLGLYAVYCQDKFNFELSDVSISDQLLNISQIITHNANKYIHKPKLALSLPILCTP